MTLQCPECNAAVSTDAKYCPSCGTRIDAASKPMPGVISNIPSAARTVKNPMSGMAKAIYTILACTLAGVFIFIFIDHVPGGSHPVIATQPEIAMASMYTDVNISPTPIEALTANGVITFPLSILQEKKMVEFDYHAGSIEVPLLAYISPEGKLVTAVRMCEPCNSKSFRMEGTELACGNCETRWKLNNLEGLQGSCQKYPPAPIPSSVINNEVHIDVSVVSNWKMRI